MAIDVTKPLKAQDLGAATTKLTAKIAPAFKAAKVENGTVSFYTSGDTTSTAAFSFNFPEEIYLRQLGTGIVSNFVFDSDTYAGAVNPNLDGKTVLTLAVRGDSDTVTYNFADMSTLVDAYTASDTALTVDNYKIKINLDASSDNILTLTNGGLFVDGSAIVTTPYTASDTSVDVADYKIKVNLDASSDNILALTANGLMVDGSNLSFDTSTLIEKVTTATAGNLAVFDSDGGVVDSGFSVATDAEVTAYLNRIFPNT